MSKKRLLITFFCLGVLSLITVLTISKNYAEEPSKVVVSTPNQTVISATSTDNTKPSSTTTSTTVKTQNPQASDTPIATVTVKTDAPAKPVEIPVAQPPVREPVFASSTTVKPSSGKMSFYFQNIEVRTLLQLIAKTSGKNFIISDSVKGNTTLNLKNVTWREALNIILASQGLASKEIDNAIFVSTTEDITQKETKKLQATLDLQNIAPLKTSMITLKYSDVTEMGKLLKGTTGTLLTQRGEVVVDAPTNTIIIKDVGTSLDDIVRFVKRLDIPTKQVSIEARIVNIDTTYESQLGVRFGASNTKSLSGTLAGANQLAQGVNVADITPLEQRLNFNIPASTLSSNTTPASIGLALARLGPLLLDLELSALEEEGHIQIISKPRVVTANQKKAIIQTGEEIPYQEATSSGATSINFKKAVLSLEIIPQITPDDKIILKLKATQDTRGPQLVISQASTTGAATPAVFGPPTINTQEVESYVLLSNNETVVIGGIYQINKTNTYDRVPFFSDIPLIGRLFKHRGIKNQKTELLVFITPKIIKSLHDQLAYKS